MRYLKPEELPGYPQALDSGVRRVLMRLPDKTRAFAAECPVCKKIQPWNKGELRADRPCKGCRTVPSEIRWIFFFVGGRAITIVAPTMAQAIELHTGTPPDEVWCCTEKHAVRVLPKVINYRPLS